MLTWLRKRLGVLTTLWLCVQGMALSAFAVNICCLQHEAMGATAGADASHAHGDAEPPDSAPGGDAECHRTRVDHCPMANANGEPCPMHAGAHQAAHDAHAHAADAAGSAPLVDQAESGTRGAAADCALSGPCGATDSALLSLMSIPAVIDGKRFVIAITPSAAPAVPNDLVPSSPRLLDTPPPRA